MKVAIICPYKYPVPAVNGGAVESIVEQIAVLNKDNVFDLTIYSIFDENAKKKSIEYNAHFVYVNARTYYWTHLYNRIFNKLSSNFYKSDFVSKIKKKELDAFDAVIVENDLNTLSHVSRIYKGRLFYHLHSDAINTTSSSKRVRALNSSNACVICVSDYIKSRVCECVSNNIKVVTLHNTVDTDLFIPVANKQNTLTIGYCGRLTKAKGIHLLLDSFKVILAKYPCVKLMVIGGSGFAIDQNDDFYYMLKNSIINIANNIVFTGFIDHCFVPKYLNMCDIIVVPSQCNEAFSLACLESMSCGKAVVASKTGGIPEMISENFLVDLTEHYVDDLTKKLIQLIENKDKIEQIGIENRNIAKEKFNVLTYLLELKDIVSDK